MEHPVKRIVRPETGGTGQTKKYPQVGETLSSGYTVIANYHNRHVLAHNELAPQPYAIWDLDQDGDTVTGRYFCEMTRAEKRFAEICFPWFDEPLCDHEASRLRSVLRELEGAIDFNEGELSTLPEECLVTCRGIRSQGKWYGFAEYLHYVGQRVNVATDRSSITVHFWKDGETLSLPAFPL